MALDISSLEQYPWNMFSELETAIRHQISSRSWSFDFRSRSVLAFF